MFNIQQILIPLLLCGGAFGRNLEPILPQQSYPGQVVFIGDSITYFWVQNGFQPWNEFYSPVGAVNTGWPGDWTDTVIDKITNQGIIDNMNSRLAVLLIGTNDLGGDASETQVVANIAKIINLIKEKNPGVIVLLLAILPRNSVEIHQKIKNVNLQIAQFADDQTVYFLDMEKQFSSQVGAFLPGMSEDGVHLTQQGYNTWAATMNPLFFSLLNGAPIPSTTPAPSTQVVFLGDSITDFFDSDGIETWNKFYAPLGAVDTGVSGDWTNTVIERITNQGIIDNLNAQVAILKIGTNDLSGGTSEETIAQNIGTIINLINEKNPGVKVLLLGILPRNGVDIHQRVRNVNALLPSYANQESVFFLNMESSFSNELGAVFQELYTDGLHLTPKGYEVWAETMNPLFFSILEGNPIPTDNPVTTLGPEPQPDSVVFLGDSITDFFDSDGISTWNEFYAPLGAVNTGVSGDWTTSVIDRINNQGIIDNLHAHVAVLKIGTNDLSGNTPEETIAQNIGLITNLIKSKNPGVKILLLGILPRNGEDIHRRVRNVNNLIASYYDSDTVFFLNMEPQFSNGLGTVIEDLFTDGLHLTAKGYAVWAETMNPLFFNLLNRPIAA